MIKNIFESKKKKELRKKRREFYLQFLDSGDVYFDVGANFGNRIDPIIDDGISIVAIEPQPKCIKKLKRKFGNKITLIPKGLGAKKDVMTMFLAKASTISTFSKDFIKATQESGRFSKYKWEKQIEVEVDTLDNIIAEHGKPKFIKIDVEGFELEVLKGLTSPIQYISCEYTVPERSEELMDCTDRIAKISENKVVFNYSIGESMEWALETWLTLEEMKKEVKSQKFIDTGFGDIYSKLT